MKVQFVFREPGNHHEIGKAWNVDCVPSAGDYVALSEEDVYTVHSVHWYFFGRQPSVTVMLDP